MSDEEIVDEFAQLHKSTSRSKTARLRDLYDHIETLRSRGFTHATIIKAMKKHGLEFDLKTFEVTFYRIKRERANAKIQERTTLPNAKIDNGVGDKSNTHAAEQKVDPISKNPLHVLSGTTKRGDFNHIPKASFEVDES